MWQCYPGWTHNQSGVYIGGEQGRGVTSVHHPHRSFSAHTHSLLRLSSPVKAPLVSSIVPEISLWSRSLGKRDRRLSIQSAVGRETHAQPATLKLRTSQSIPDAWTACLPKITGVRKQTYACLYTWLDLKWITNKDLLNSTGSSAQCHVAAWEGRGLGENGHMRVYG